eukprot:Platyproteum_vivax@DN13084_c0_g1_i1.p1
MSSGMLVASLDFSQAFPSIGHDYLFFVLCCLELPVCFQQHIQSFYGNAQMCFEVKEAKSKIIKIHKGVLQGDPLSPLLFCMCVNPILQRIRHEMAHKPIALPTYMDDITILGDTQTVKRCIQTVANLGESIGLSLNPRKCYTISYGNSYKATPATVYLNGAKFQIMAALWAKQSLKKQDCIRKTDGSANEMVESGE